MISCFLLLYSHFLPGNTLDFYDSVNASVVSTDIQAHEYRAARGPRTVTYTYTAVFSGTYSDGGSFRLEQYVPESMYSSYSAIQGGNPIPMILYKSSPGGEYFLSTNKHTKALKEYRTSNPTLKLKSASFGIASFCVLFASALFATFGGHEIRLSRKYPRSDVEIDPTELAAKQDSDDLMKEFDAAYEKHMARKKMGLPPDDGISASRLPDKGSDKTNA